jgi:hypothetical protein
MKNNVLSSIFGYGMILISLFLLASYRPGEQVEAAALSAEPGIVYAMDPVDLKLFNSAETPATYTLATVHPADRKFFAGMAKSYPAKNARVSQRTLEADAARYSALATHHLENARVSQRTLEADAARYSALATYHLENARVSQRTREADAARYSALATYHLEKVQVSRQNALEAASARFTGLAEFYSGGK